MSKSTGMLVDEFVDLLQERGRRRGDHADSFVVGYLNGFLIDIAFKNPEIAHEIAMRVSLMKSGEVDFL
jgi:hypothetical protein